MIKIYIFLNKYKLCYQKKEYNNIMKNLLKSTLFIAITTVIYSNNCTIAPALKPYIITSDLSKMRGISDISNNYNELKKLCTTLVGFKDGSLYWRLLLVTNPNREHGLFWFLPHDNENSAFKSAIYAVKRYGGGFLAIVNSNKRYNRGQDPNRAFSYSPYKICSGQIEPTNRYTNIIFSTIDFYKLPNTPYLALHNNTNRGGISILKSNAKTKSYLAYPKSKINSQNPLTDEDNLVYMAGLSKNPPTTINKLLNLGINVKYEVVNSNNNDCSMSNFIVLEKGVNNYYNIEAQHGKTAIQKMMIDKLVRVIYK